MNYFIEGLQGSGKSTLMQKLSERKSGCTPIREGEYSPGELAWCAWKDEKTHEEILAKYAPIRALIEEKTYAEGARRIICYTKIRTDIPGFYQDLERHEIYNGRTPFASFRDILLRRYGAWNGDGQIFECSLFQNTIEDMILFRCFGDAQILDFYRRVREALEGKDYKIVYLKTTDIKANLDRIRKERSDAEGKELWFPLMLGFFDGSPYAKEKGVSGEEALIEHFRLRQALEMRICEEIFPDRSVILPSKGYTPQDLDAL